MSFFDNLVNNGKALGNQISSAMGNAANQTGVDAKNSAERTSLEMEIATLNNELDKSYLLIGHKYVEYLIVMEKDPEIDIADVLKLMAPKLKKKKELEDKLAALEKEDKEQHIIAQKLEFEREYQEQKTKLDKALTMDIITEEEYKNKLMVYKNKVDHFDEMRKIKAQYEMGIIDASEMHMKLRAIAVECDKGLALDIRVKPFYNWIFVARI